MLPALQIAKALRAEDTNTRIDFVGSGRPLEQKLIGAAGYPLHILAVSGVKGRGLRGLLQFLLRLPLSFFRTWRLISELRPQCVVGVGGYVSVLPVVVAALRGIPTWVHEAELQPGLANELLGRIARSVSVAFREAKMPSPSRVLYTGHPIRPELAEVQAHRVWPEKPRRLLIMGGSQGAAAIDRACAALAPLFAEQGLSVTHQCREESSAALKQAYHAAGVAAEVVTFIDDMTSAYAGHDFAMCRAGAGTVMEIEAINLPVIFVPYPFAQAGHQSANAQTLSQRGKALVVEEGVDFEQRLEAAVRQMTDPCFYREMRERAVETRSLDAAKTIANGILKLAEMVKGK